MSKRTEIDLPALRERLAADIERLAEYVHGDDEPGDRLFALGQHTYACEILEWLDGRP